MSPSILHGKFVSYHLGAAFNPPFIKNLHYNILKTANQKSEVLIEEIPLKSWKSISASCRS